MWDESLTVKGLRPGAEEDWPALTLAGVETGDGGPIDEAPLPVLLFGDEDDIDEEGFDDMDDDFDDDFDDDDEGGLGAGDDDGEDDFDDDEDDDGFDYDDVDYEDFDE